MRKNVLGLKIGDLCLEHVNLIVLGLDFGLESGVVFLEL